MCEYIKHLVKYPISRTSRNYIKNYQPKIKLIMTLVVRNEEEILEKHIRFHHAMGVDGFIVISHKSTDKTNEILEKLKKEGLVFEIIHKDTPNHQHSVWVKDMIRLAKNKYKADWIINSDADEFYYSKDLNLKTSILKYSSLGVNILIVDSIFVFPYNEENFLLNEYFVTKPFQNFEIEQLGLKNDERFQEFTGSQGCTKVIHNTKDFKKVSDGNHFAEMRNKKETIPSNINLYHFHIRNYKGYENKVLRWIDSAQHMPEGQGQHMKDMIQMYKKGTLKENYENYFGNEMREFLIKQGVVTIDKSVSNYLKWKGII